MAKNNPWLALSTYEEEDSYKFKGRDNDTANLVKLLRKSDCVVCYAASGDGKSSLINAGVCPQIRKLGMFPVKIVFDDADFNDPNINFDRVILEKINDRLEEYKAKIIEKHQLKENEFDVKFEKETKYDDIVIPNSLWWKLRTETIQMSYEEFDYIPVLIFDQFEEVLRSLWKDKFFQWLEKMARDVCPEEIVNQLADTLKSRSIDFPSRKLFKTLFSMRYEYVGELDYWCSQRHYIPQMMYNRYFLKPLTREQAIEIIQAQGEIGDPISERLKNDSENIVESIISSSSNTQGEDDSVSAIMLSLTCYVRYENDAVNSSDSSPEDLDTLIYSHYKKQLSLLGMSDEERTILEEALVSPQGTRNKVATSDNRLQQINIDNYIGRNYNLFSTNLFKKEKTKNYEEDHQEYYIELVHDKLAEAILKNKKETSFIQSIKARRTFWYIALPILLFLAFVVTFFLNHPISIPKDRNRNRNEAPLIISSEDVKSFQGFDYKHATSITLRRKVFGLNSDYLDCYKNVLVWYDKARDCYCTRYAHNARTLTFADYTMPLGLSFGENTEKVFLLSENNRFIDSLGFVFCDNKNTIIYVPYGSMGRCEANRAFNQVNVQELGLASTFLKKLSYCIHSFKNGLSSGNALVFLLYLAFGVIFVWNTANNDFKPLRKDRKWKAICLLVICCVLGIALLAEVLGLLLEKETFVLYILYLICVMAMMLTIPKLILRLENLKIRSRKTGNSNSKKQKVPLCWIVYNTPKHQSYAVALKKDLILNGINEDDIQLDLNIAKPTGIDLDIVYKTYSYQNIIFFFDNDTLFSSEKNNKYFSFLQAQDNLHPILIDTKAIEDIAIPPHLKTTITTRNYGTTDSFKVLAYQPSSVETYITIQQLIHDLRQQKPAALKKANRITIVLLAISILGMALLMNSGKPFIVLTIPYIVGAVVVFTMIDKVWEYYSGESDFPWLKKQLAKIRRRRKG